MNFNDCTLHIYDLTNEQLKNKKFLQSQIKKYETRYKNSRQKTARLKDVITTYKGLLKGDHFYTDMYLDKEKKPVKNPCKKCGRECYGNKNICYQCQKNAYNRNKSAYEIDIFCAECGKDFYPKLIGLPWEEGDRTECSCGYEIIIKEKQLKTQRRIEQKTYSYLYSEKVI